MRTSLRALEFQVDESDPVRWLVEVPSFRRDVEREADLIEEVARHRGYDAIPSRLPLLPDDGVASRREDRGTAQVRGALLAAGLSEAINFAMGDREELLLLAPATPPIRVENPLQSQAAWLRTTLLPGLLRNLAHNLNHGGVRCRLFEIGRVFAPSRERPLEPERVAGVLAGRGLPEHWSLPRREVDLYDARGAVELIAERLGIPSLRFASDRITSDLPITGLRVLAGASDIGVLGEVAPAVLRRFEVDGRAFAFEVDLDALRGAGTGKRKFTSLPRFPAVRRDLSLVVGETTGVAEVEGVVRSAAGQPIGGIQVFDRYRGPGVPAGRASVAIQIVFQHPDRTLEAAEAQAALERIVVALRDRLGATLREE
jgi:phenylalanyl-tRNA synthetase beta chain